MAIRLYEHQKLAVSQLKSGSILNGGVGSGKSLTALDYYFEKQCGGTLDKDGRAGEMADPKDLYIITTAAKRDTLDWEHECSYFPLADNRDISVSGVKVLVDSWNNIKKYVNVENAFFIFDEQRVVGSGAWVKSFIKITKKNNWILLSATPGDSWMDYIPVFVANGFYKNRTDFLRTHVVYNTFTKYPKVDHYVETGKLLKLKREITVDMWYEKPTSSHYEVLKVNYDKEQFDLVTVKRWNPFTNKPVKEISEYCHTMRRVVNSDPSRLKTILDLMNIHDRMIIFYTFNYELDILRTLSSYLEVAEHNGHKHEPLPKSEKWIYLVQYTSGSEGWNCVETNVIVFYSQNYSYRMMTQAAGRIDRMNTEFKDLYYYTLRSDSWIDLMIARSLKNKKSFNELKLKKSFERRL